MSPASETAAGSWMIELHGRLFYIALKDLAIQPDGRDCMIQDGRDCIMDVC
jgi:hypothetical protein